MNDSISLRTRNWAASHDWFDFSGNNWDTTYTIYTTTGEVFKSMIALRNWAGY